MRSSSVVGAFVVVIVVAWAGGVQAKTPVGKVTPWVLDHTAPGVAAELLVVMRDQADLGNAETLPTRAEKGRFVRDTLWDVARISQTQIRRWLDTNGVTYRQFYIVNALWVSGDRAVVDALAARSDVARVEGNPHFQAVDPREQATSTPSPTEAQPESVEWGIAKTNAPTLWAKGYTGQGVVVGGQDTGYLWTHAALKSAYRGWDGATASHDYNWHDAIHSGGGSCGANSTVPCDDYGHGTHTMGTVLGLDGSNQIGMAPGARWIGCRNMNAGVGSPATYLECFEFLLAPYPVSGTPAQGDPDKAPDVTNNSWGCPLDEGCTAWDILKSAVEAQKAAGIMTVVSAGNDGSTCGSVIDPPAIYGASFSVGATDSSDALASFSSRGPATMSGSPALMKPDVVAPGVDVRSSTSDGSYGTMSGTSMAGPHVAGAVALLWSAFPSLKNDQDATAGLLTRTARRLPALVEGCGGDYVNGPNNSWGYGLIDLAAAFNSNIDLRPTALQLDDSSGGYNGVWDFGDFAVLRPTWKNFSTIAAAAVAGTLTSSDAVWINDGQAVYGDIPVAGSKTCTNCYGVTATGPRPAPHWDVTLHETLSTGTVHDWVLHVGGSFSDVGESYAFYPQVETILHAAITSGCTATTYCPASPVIRLQMAAFLARGMAGADANLPTSGSAGGHPYSCTSGGPTLFSDIAPTTTFCRHVHYLATQGVTLGCTTTTFCPGLQVTRRQMSAFVARAMAGGDANVPVTYTNPTNGRGYSCDPSSPSTHFSDLPAGDPNCRHANYLWAKAVIDGCTASEYCPASVVSRGQMAKFLVNAFALGLYQ